VGNLETKVRYKVKAENIKKLKLFLKKINKTHNVKKPFKLSS